VFSTVTWPAGTTVDGDLGGLRVNFNNYASNGSWIILPNPVAGSGTTS
jgi:hypothetical protein